MPPSWRFRKNPQPEPRDPVKWHPRPQRQNQRRLPPVQHHRGSRSHRKIRIGHAACLKDQWHPPPLQRRGGIGRHIHPESPKIILRFRSGEFQLHQQLPGRNRRFRHKYRKLLPRQAPPLRSSTPSPPLAGSATTASSGNPGTAASDAATGRTCTGTATASGQNPAVKSSIQHFVIPPSPIKPSAASSQEFSPARKHLAMPPGNRTRGQPVKIS